MFAALSSFFSRLFAGPTVRILTAPRAELRAPERFLSGLADPPGFMEGLGWLHEAMEDLTGLPTGKADRLVIKHEEASYGAMWAYADGGPGHHIGIPGASWPNTIAAANRRQLISPLVHEIGHVAFWWDWDPQAGAHYLMWPGATEGLATPTGTYACLKYRRVPAWSDHPGGQADWASLADWAAQWINQGLEARAGGAAGQDSVTVEGHGAGAAIVEACMFDLLFRVLGPEAGYAAYRTVLRDYAAQRRTPEQAMRGAQEKMEDFFLALGEAAGRDLAGYLKAWGFDVPRVAAGLAHLPAIDPALPAPHPVRYGAVSDEGWA